MGFNIPMPFKYGLDLNFSAFVAIGLVYLITAIEAYWRCDGQLDDFR